MTRNFEDYDPSKDKEHLEIWNGRQPATRDELIQWAGILANKTGKRVRVNAMNIVPNKPPEPVDRVAAAGWAIGGAFALILLLGLIIALAAALTGNIP